MERRTFGFALVTIASVLWSTAGLFVRLLDVDVWTMLTWRSLFASLALFVVAAVQSRWRWRWRQTWLSIGWPGLVAIPISAVSMISYVAALKLTTVANVLTVYATVPFMAAGLAYLWLGERTKPQVLWASGIALAGILIMAGSATRLQDVAGNALALLMTFTFAVVLVMARRYPSLGLALINALAAALCALACWPLGGAVLPSGAEMAILATFGMTTTALAYLLFLTGGRFIPSSEAGLIALLDVVLGPLWVWLAFSERPSLAAILGGSLVLTAVSWYLAGEMRQARTARLA